MSLSILTSYSAITPGKKVSFKGVGGVEPYTYTVTAGGAGGTIDSNGLYTAPDVLPVDPSKAFDTITVTDSDVTPVSVSTTILVGGALLMTCDILQKELGLAAGRVYLWSQKIMQPTDSALYVAVSVISSKILGNNRRNAESVSDLSSDQSVNVLATLGIDIISRSTEALHRKEEVLLALNSDYALKQQELNSFRIGTTPAGGQFTNLSGIDGAAIPYRFHIPINIQYVYTKMKTVDYFDSFSRSLLTD